MTSIDRTAFIPNQSTASGGGSSALLMKLFTATAGAVALLGLAVMIGWHTHNKSIVQLHVGLVPMQYNTALGFLLCGSALIALIRGNVFLLRIAASLVAVIGTTTLAEYFLGINIGIDELLMQHDITTLTSHSGRMAPSTALAFVLSSTSLLCASQPWRQSHNWIAATTLCASSILAIATATLIGYAAELRPLIGWGATTYMALHTALGHLLLGATLLGWGIVTQQQRGMDRLNLIGLLSATALVMISLLMWSGLERNEGLRTRAALDSNSHWFGLRVDAAYRERAGALERMGSRWEKSGGTARAAWESDAESYVRTLPGFRAVEWVDAAGRVQWVIPLAGNEQVVGLDNMADPTRAQIFTRARDLKKTLVSEPLTLKQGGTGFLIIKPLFIAERFDGFVVAVFQIESMSENLTGLESDLAVAFAHDEQPAESNFAAPPRAQQDEQSARVPLELGDGRWSLIVTANNTKRDLLRSALPVVVLASGVLTAGFVAAVFYLWGLTAKRAREAAHANTLLRDHAEHTQAIVDHMVDGIVTLDQEGNIRSFNPAAERIFGYTTGEVLGKTINWFVPTPLRHSQSPGTIKQCNNDVLQLLGVGHEVDGRRKDGSLFSMEVSISEVTRQGQPMYVALMRDISERKRIERMKVEFVSTVSHELRTPLTSISGALGLIAGGSLGAISVQAQQMMAIARRNSERLGILINDLLDMEKLVAGKMHFDLQTRALLPLVEQAIEANQAYGIERGVALILTRAVPDAVVLFDKDRLMQVLANLMSNAIKYSRADGIVEISVDRHDHAFRITVTDHGEGIPQNFRARIFQKFSQADSSDTRQRGGTGLGLAITRELVLGMGGNIGFESEEGHGARFYVDLPLAGATEKSVIERA